MTADRTPQRGFSLPELLIATALGVPLLMTALELYATAREVEPVERAHARVLEQARLARHLLTAALHTAGYPTDVTEPPIRPAIIPDTALMIRHGASTTHFFTDQAVGHSAGHSLYRRRGAAGGQREELVTGIEQLTVRYGVSMDGDRRVDAFQNAGQVTDANAILAVELRFFVTNIHDVAPRLRYPVTLVVALRNEG